MSPATGRGTLAVRGGRVIDERGERTADVLVDEHGTIVDVGPNLTGDRTLDASGCIVSPGFVDLHVHLRQPGKEEAETVETGARGAALGGFTAVVAMPNTDPTMDNASVIRDVFLTVPPMLRESAYGIGATTGEVVRHIVIPYTRTGIVGGIMLGLGRALGETMAVTFVIGNAHDLSLSLLAPGTTISATLANEFSEAVGPLYVSSLFALGLILFVITFIVLAAAKLLLLRLERQAAT